MSDTTKTRELYGLYVQRFGSCPRTPYQADYYRKWLDLLTSCASNEEAEEKSKQNGLYTAGAAAVAKDRVYANKQAAEKMGWTDVAEFCDEIIGKIEADPYYVFTHSGLWGDLQAKKNGWLRTIDGFHRLFVDFREYDDERTEPERAVSAITQDLKMLSKPTFDFVTLAALPQFRAIIDCNDEYYKEFVEVIGKVASTGRLDSIQWSADKDAVAELWKERDSLKGECAQWYSQAVKPCCVRLSPSSADGKYELKEID
ncbi:MAG: hypothetical protein K6A64_03395 [Bacteroidales bacterium]|nr:hypothetical protein [Bacteroidales bacterium]